MVTKDVDHLKLLTIEETLSSMVGKMPPADWKQPVVNQPLWMREDAEVGWKICGAKVERRPHGGSSRASMGGN